MQKKRKENGIEKKDFRHLRRFELIEIISRLLKGQTDGEKKESEIPIEEVEQERIRLKYRRNYWRVFRSTIYGLIVVAALSVLISTLLLPLLKVSGSSMEPTLNNGDYVFVVKNAEFKTGDLCAFYFQNKLLLKRVIAGPGDWVDIDENGVVSVNGEKIDEPYVKKLSKGECDIALPYQVPENRYFLMGDSREVSIDSRSSRIGSIEKDQILGKVVVRIWPLKEFEFIL